MNYISPILNIMIKACEKASKVIIRDFGEIENLQVKKKGPKDFVTKTDKRVEKILIEDIDYYYSNTIARASKTMSECRYVRANLKKTGTEG